MSLASLSDWPIGQLGPFRMTVPKVFTFLTALSSNGNKSSGAKKDQLREGVGAFVWTRKTQQPKSDSFY